ncbi:MAG: glycine cleavage system protein GcvH [Thiohalobacteraceae bacterium]|nr:glycine cleavage system protein GcvH [Gammaproteobacteria bacterium]
MTIPEDLLYNTGHLWCRCEQEGLYRIGVSHHAQSSLGEIAYVELPDPGATIVQNESFGAIESIKVVNELMSPLSGTVVEINDNLRTTPTLVNETPYNDGWMLLVRVDDDTQLTILMNSGDYSAFIR